MKKIRNLVIILLLISSHSMLGQEYSQELKGGSDLTVRIDNVIANLIINGHSGNTLTIDATGLNPPPEKAEGLKALKRSGVDNTGLALNIHQTGNMLIISGGSSEQDLSYTIGLPEGVNVSIENNGFFYPKNLVVNKMKGEVEIDSYFGTVDLLNVSGPVVARVNNGELNVTFTELNQESPMSLISSQSDIDVTLPSSSKATFKLAAGSGEIYTDLDLEKLVEEKEDPELVDLLKVYSESEGKFVAVPNINNRNNYRFRYNYANILQEDSTLAYNKARSNYVLGGMLYSDYFGSYDYKGTLNGGGVEISVRTQNGNLYLRKSK